MTSAWGGSWGGAWGDSWGVISTGSSDVGAGSNGGNNNQTLAKPKLDKRINYVIKTVAEKTKELQLSKDSKQAQIQQESLFTEASYLTYDIKQEIVKLKAQEDLFREEKRLGSMNAVIDDIKYLEARIEEIDIVFVAFILVANS